MQQFQVPQFISVEDRIIGPLTLQQFLYLLGAGGVGLLGWFFLPFFLFLLMTLPPAGFFVAMAFAKIGGRPFPTIFMSAINYYLKPRLYLWRHEKPAPQPSAEPQAAKEEPLLASIPKLSESKLSELAWSLDIKEKIQREYE